MADDEFWQLEADFWTADADWCQRHLAAQAVMVFPPPAGMLDRNRIIESIRARPRREAVEMEGRQMARPRPDTVVLAYRAIASRTDGQAPYCAVCGSVYTLTADGWKLVLHQQAPQNEG